MKKPGIIFIVLVIFFSLAFIWWKNGISPVDPVSKQQVIFVIQKGSGVREIANQLKAQGLIKDPVVFFLLVKKMGLDNKIQAGDFRLSPSQSATEIALALTHGTLDIWITIPEGKRAEEIADILQDKIPTYKPAWRPVLNRNEGYLFPDTYLIPRDVTVDFIVSMMRDNFEKKFAQIQPSNKNILSKEQIIILASIIEREAKFSNDRSLVASVLLNRINLGMPLQVDATIQYALGYQTDEKRWWKKGLTNQDLKIDSAYNTYTQVGLPHTPISNPGFDVLNSTANPADTDYLYYISDKSGHNHYAKTLAEHNANIRKYGL
ncbi:MAG: endolytic transglycosylase MltG [Candidatus Levybacteria bacterium]|nr:endolytic transglycosylase MltG [Candidatus Levybacteria bacterium]